jgi:signal transduction histidine kinase
MARVRPQPREHGSSESGRRRSGGLALGAGSLAAGTLGPIALLLEVEPAAAAILAGLCGLGAGAIVSIDARRDAARDASVREIEARLREIETRLRENEASLDAAVRESRRSRALLDGAADMVLVVDAATGAVIESNARAREELGSPALLADLLSEDDAPLLRDVLASSTGGALTELRVRTTGGSVLDCEARLAPVDLGDVRAVHVALRDRTRERAIERELAVRERLASLGLLTAGVAHEINNPLEGIGNHVKLLGRADLSADDRARHLDLVRHGFERIRDLVRDLLRFARPAPPRGEVDLAVVVVRARQLASYSRQFRDIEIVEIGLDRPLRVVGDAGRLEQVVFNLLLNAAKATGGRGRIEIAAQRSIGGSRTIALTVADDGPGIAPDQLERIFDPFFTTGDGTGLGLSIAFGILQAHGGSLAARNRPEGGAEFTLRFPAPSAVRTGEAA